MDSHASDLPDPHPLDFDWRFTSDAAAQISALIPKHAQTLAIGTPSVARHMEAERRPVTLVDRQPFQNVQNHFPIDIHDHGPVRQSFDYAVIDPPWYPEALRYWLAWAASSVRRNGVILAAVWPDYTRPTAPEELADLQGWISLWGEISLPEVSLKYVTPLFETLASKRSRGRRGSQSPGAGNLLQIKVRSRPRLAHYKPETGAWKRFILNNYQLALGFGGQRHKGPALERHPLAEDWTWPYVSRRALGRSQIDLWSSENEVALVGKPDIIHRVLKKAVRMQSKGQFELALSDFPDLLEWDIPRPPYWRNEQWQHPR